MNSSAHCGVAKHKRNLKPKVCSTTTATTSPAPICVVAGGRTTPFTTSTTSLSVNSSAANAPPGVVAKDIDAPTVLAVNVSAPPTSILSESSGRVCLCSTDSSCNLCMNASQVSISRAEVESLLAQRESAIRAELNMRLLFLEDQVSKLSQTIHTLSDARRSTQATSFASAVSRPRS